MSIPERWGRPVFESWVDRQVREATERGEFDVGRGRPLPDLSRAGEDPDWWARRRLEQEDLRGVLPGPLAVRREKQDVQATLADVRDEATARAVVADLNERIRRANATPVGGRTFLTGLLDVDEVLATWRASRAHRDGGDAR